MGKTKFHWDPVSDTVVQEKDGSGVTQATYHSDPVTYGRLFSMRRGGETYHYRYDAQGNTRALTESSGQTTDAYRYDAWGVRVHTSGSTTNPFRYGGRVGYQSYSMETLYVRARTYRPRLASWLSRDVRWDPFRGFIYCRNSPVSTCDPSGMKCLAVRHRTKKMNFRAAGQFFARVSPKASRGELTTVTFVFWAPLLESEFRDSDGCCCCDRVGFIQFYEDFVASDNPFEVMLGNADLQVDAPPGELFYPHGRRQNRPCSSNWQDTAHLEDVPVTKVFSPFLSYHMTKFTTCAVCMEGYEGPRYKMVTGTLLPTVSYRVDSVVSYGCVGWSMMYENRNGKITKKYSVAGNSTSTYDIVDYLGSGFIPYSNFSAPSRLDSALARHEFKR